MSHSYSTYQGIIIQSFGVLVFFIPRRASHRSGLPGEIQKGHHAYIHTRTDAGASWNSTRFRGAQVTFPTVNSTSRNCCSTQPFIVQGHVRLPVAEVAVTFEFTPSMFRVESMLFDTVHIHKPTRTIQKVSSLRAIHTLRLCLSQVQWPRIARLPESIQPCQAWPASISFTLRTQLVHFFSHPLLKHTLRLSKGIQNFGILSVTHPFSHTISVCRILFPYFIHPSHSAPLTVLLQKNSIVSIRFLHIRSLRSIYHRRHHH